jgi:hypothetical protein
MEEHTGVSLDLVSCLHILVELFIVQLREDIMLHLILFHRLVDPFDGSLHIFWFTNDNISVIDGIEVAEINMGLIGSCN